MLETLYLQAIQYEELKFYTHGDKDESLQQQNNSLDTGKSEHVKTR